MILSFAQRLAFKCLAAALMLLLLCRCGGGPPPSSGAGRYITQAHESEKQAISYEEKGHVTEALAMYRDAVEKLDTGLKCALAAERPQFLNLKERIEPKIAELELRQKLKKEREEADAKKAEEQKRAAALIKTDATKDAEEARRNAEEEAMRKAAAERVKQVQQLTASDAVKTAQKAAAGGDDDAHPQTPLAGTAEGAAPQPTGGPFKTYGKNEKPPRLSVDKVEVRGEFLYAYIQIHNDAPGNKRIARVDVVFTTLKDADLCSSDINIKYSEFNESMADPLDHTTGVITLNNHEVFGSSSFQFVAIAKDKERAPRAKKARASIMFEDGDTWTERGPQEAKAVTADGLPGL